MKLTLMVLCLGTEQDLEVICKHGITKTDINKFKVQLSLSAVASSFRPCCPLKQHDSSRFLLSACVGTGALFDVCGVVFRRLAIVRSTAFQ